MNKTYHFRVGDFACTSVFDQNDTGPAELVFANAPDKELAAALRVHGLDPRAISLSKTCLAVNTRDQWVLLDAGMGSALRRCSETTSYSLRDFTRETHIKTPSYF